MNTTRIIVFGLVGLVVGVMIGFGFRGSLAEMLNLDAALPVTINSTTADIDNDWTNVVGIGLKETDFYDKAESVKVPATILINQTLAQQLGTIQGFPGLRVPAKLSFDLGTMTGAEMKAIDTCMADAAKTYSQCLVSDVIKTRATKK